MPTNIEQMTERILKQIDGVSASVERLKSESRALREALEEVEEYLDDRADVNDGDYGRPVANEALRLLTIVRAALGRAT